MAATRNCFSLSHLQSDCIQSFACCFVDVYIKHGLSLSKQNSAKPKKKKKQRCHPTTKKHQNVTAVKQNNATSMNPAHAALQYIKWSSVKDRWFIQDKGEVSVQQPVLQEPLAAITAWTETLPPTHLQKWPLQYWVEEHWQDNVGKLALLPPLLYLSCGEIEDLISRAVSQHLPHYKRRKKKLIWQCLLQASTFWGVVKNPRLLLKHSGYFHIFCGAPFVCPASKLDSLVHGLMMLLPVTYILIASWKMAIENQLN